MKTLFAKIISILESKTISSLGVPFSDFEQFIMDWVLSDDPYGWNNKSGEKMQSYNKIAKALEGKTKNCDETIHALYIYALTIFSNLEECKINSKDILVSMYDTLSNMPISKISNGFAMGMEGIVIDRGNTIIKYFFSGQIPKTKEKFYRVCKEKKYKVFPYVERIGKGYVIMEKLKMHTNKCHKYQQIIDKMYDRVSSSNYDITQYSKDVQEVILWMEDVRTAIKDTTDFNDFGDLDEKNFGERNDGTIVYFDI